MDVKKLEKQEAKLKVRFSLNIQGVVLNIGHIGQDREALSERSL